MAVGGARGRSIAKKKLGSLRTALPVCVINNKLIISRGFNNTSHKQSVRTYAKEGGVGGGGVAQHVRNNSKRKILTGY